MFVSFSAFSCSPQLSGGGRGVSEQDLNAWLKEAVKNLGESKNLLGVTGSAGVVYSWCDHHTATHRQVMYKLHDTSGEGATDGFMILNGYNGGKVAFRATINGRVLNAGQSIIVPMGKTGVLYWSAEMKILELPRDGQGFQFEYDNEGNDDRPGTLLVEGLTPMVNGTAVTGWEISRQWNLHILNRKNGQIVITDPPDIPAKTCTVLGNTHKLPHVSVSSFTEKNATAGQMPFDVKFYCDNTTAVTVDVTMKDANDNGNTLDEIGDGTAILTNTGTASGIGIKISDRRANGENKFSTLNTIWKENIDETNVNITHSIPLSAEYIQFGNTVSAGSVNARATVTAEYK